MSELHNFQNQELGQKRTESTRAVEMLYTVPEVAEILKTSVDYVYKLQRSGILQFLKIGRLKVRKSTLEEFLAKYDGCDLTDPFNVQELKLEGV